VWDALIAKNTIQVIGVCIADLALLVYGALQIDQIHEAITILKSKNVFWDENVWYQTKGELIAIPAIIGLITLILSFMAWKLYQEFAWDILKQIGADYRMKKRFLHYQVCPFHLLFTQLWALETLTRHTDLHRSAEIRLLLLCRFYDPVSSGGPW